MSECQVEALDGLTDIEAIKAISKNTQKDPSLLIVAPRSEDTAFYFTPISDPKGVQSRLAKHKIRLCPQCCGSGAAG